ncbi:enterobactin synthetase component E [includes: 2,3-dihydroxybenzoate-AMP ligase; S-dihydroxybenzoyltransferase] [Escherichia coli]|nr:enterobactin synthetase component E [includes: 2,3-dihydroxybenzoate-AMP ligase; S-dihydroxybenzoyltransferase] [Escherichia coli]
MSIPFTAGRKSLPVAIGKRLLAGLPLTDILTRHAASDGIAVIDGERQLSYRELNQRRITSPVVCAVRALNLVKPRWYNWVTSLNFTLPFSRC